MATHHSYRNLNQRPSITRILNESDEPFSPQLQSKTKQDNSKYFLHIHKPPFNIDYLTTRPEYFQSDKFRYFVMMLKQWNIKVAQGIQLSQTQFLQVQFIFSNLLYVVSVDQKNKLTILDKLFNWAKNNQRQKPQFILKKDQPIESNEEYFVRQTFKTNVPQQIKLYERKMIGFPTYKLNLPRRLTKDSRKTDKMNIHSELKHKVKKYVQFKENMEVDSEMQRYRKNKNKSREQLLKKYNDQIFTQDKQWISATTSPQRRQCFDQFNTMKQAKVKKNMGYRFNRLNLTEMIQERNKANDLTNVTGLNLIDKEQMHTKSKIKRVKKLTKQ